VDADASSLTSLKVGDRVTAVFPDIGGGHDLVLSGRVAYIELHPVQVGVPWAEYLDGDPPSIVMSWEKWLDGLDESHEAQTLTVWIGCERIWIVPADLDDAEPPAPDVRGAARRELLPAPPAAEAAQPEARERLGGAAVGAQGEGDDRRALRAAARRATCRRTTSGRRLRAGTHSGRACRSALDVLPRAE